MYLQRLKDIMEKRGLNQAAVAKGALVSRAAVTKWFQTRGDWVNVETKTIIQLASKLSLSPDIFLKPAPQLFPYTTRYLWDSLYPNMEGFLNALIQNRPPALARLVQVAGFHNARLIAGKKIVTQFDRYKKFIKPLRRKQLETVWPLYISKK